MRDAALDVCTVKIFHIVWTVNLPVKKRCPIRVDIGPQRVIKPFQFFYTVDNGFEPCYK